MALLPLAVQYDNNFLERSRFICGLKWIHNMNLIPLVYNTRNSRPANWLAYLCGDEYTLPMNYISTIPIRTSRSCQIDRIMLFFQWLINENKFIWAQTTTLYILHYTTHKLKNYIHAWMLSFPAFGEMDVLRLIYNQQNQSMANFVSIL